MDQAASFVATMEAMGNSWKMTVTLSYTPVSEATGNGLRWQIKLGDSAEASGATARQAFIALLANLRLEAEG